jgi:hypothetical protein
MQKYFKMAALLVVNNDIIDINVTALLEPTVINGIRL